MELKDNPLLQKENYFKGYDESVEKLKNNPQLIEFDKLCYEIFEKTDAGKRFLELVTDRYLLAPAGAPSSKDFEVQAVWAEGVRYSFLLMLNAIKSHKQRIEAKGSNA